MIESNSVKEMARLLTYSQSWERDTVLVALCGCSAVGISKALEKIQEMDRLRRVGEEVSERGPRSTVEFFKKRLWAIAGSME